MTKIYRGSGVIMFMRKKESGVWEYWFRDESNRYETIGTFDLGAWALRNGYIELSIEHYLNMCK